jgi:hypothetical protein
MVGSGNVALCHQDGYTDAAYHEIAVCINEACGLKTGL